MDIAVTRGWDLVYTDYKHKSINLVTDKQIQQLVKLQGWKPYGYVVRRLMIYELLWTVMIEKKHKSFVIQAQWFSSSFSGMTKTSLSFRLEHFLTLNTLL